MKRGKYIIYILLLVVASLQTVAAISGESPLHVMQPAEQQPQQPADTVTGKKPRYSVKKTAPQYNEKELKQGPADLKDPENISLTTEYDEKTGHYVIGSKMGDSYLNAPVLMTPEEYTTWSMKQSMNAYYRNRNTEEYEKAGKEKFDFSDMHFDLGPAEKIFGPGGVRIKTQGSAELKFGGRYKNTENPSLPDRQRKTFGFEFDEKVNLNINGKVGDKMSLDMNYNTDATFDFDTKKIKLAYEGKEDEIIQLLEAGNVSMPTNSSLIRGATSLFGIRADLQFGKLKLQTVVSQKESSSKTVSSKGGSQLTDFEVSAANYDENRHFFLSHYFRDNYDKNMASLPNVMSGINITRVEIWVTNKTSNYDNPRNIIALTDLGESKKISNPMWTATGGSNPSNASNSLYQSLVNQYGAARDITQTTSVLDGIPGFSGSVDYEKIENARLLTANEYMLNRSVGYVSLKQTLQPDDVLAVAYEYTLGGTRYQVGEFAADVSDTKQAIYVKLLKNTSNQPGMGTWDLMMKNVYALGATSVQKEKFRLDIKYQSDTAGVYLNYIPEPALKETTLLRALNLDRLDNNNQSRPNGFFDFVEGYTVVAQNGRIYFPVVEPFGDHLRKFIGNNQLAEKYVFDELYDSTKTVAKQIAEKDKFIFTGQYKATNGSEIDLGAWNIPQGSVTVTAGGVTLVENSDYTVDYSSGRVTIINQSIIDAGTAVNVSLESNTNFSMQRKTMLGMNFMYDFSKEFQFGGTIMHLSEKPQTSKVAMGSEPLKNTLWGANIAWKKESQWLTNMIDKLPLLEATQPSTINLTAEFAQLIAGEASGVQGNASYLDDFESTENGIDVRQPESWMLSSTPSGLPNATLVGDTKYGMDRAMLSWYYIDPLFTRRSSSLTPSHIKSDLEQLSNHYVREVYERELYPNKEAEFNSSTTLNILNLAYYPDERGPYNLDTDLTPEGKLPNPAKRWGGMMRKLETSDFETANIEYVEFWMMDPFMYEAKDTRPRGGDFYIHLGEVSEDVLKDGKKFFENGMPADGSPRYTETVWGRVPTDRSIVYAFDNTSGARGRQDVGLDGLSNEEEAAFPTYRDYLSAIQSKVSAEAFAKFQADPAGDNYHHYRGSDHDDGQVGILERYKYINNTEGNSVASEDSPESYDISYKRTPDVEDINQDYTLGEYEKYYQYYISMRPEDLQVGRNYIVDKRVSSVKLRNGNTEEATWYQFRIPVDEYEKAVGGINGLNSIRFMRMYLTGFEQPIVLRFATLDLIRAEWRTYGQALYNTATAPTVSGSVNVSSVNIEENGDREPVNYVLPPGISRVLDPSQPQLRQDNEQALCIKVTDLNTGDARAIYKNINIDLRQYNRLQMFTHANAPVNDVTGLEDGEVSVFIRLGSDYKNNFYEYEIPLKLTPAGNYDRYSGSSATAVWPEENMLDIDFSVFTDLKKARNMARGVAGSGVSYTTLYSQYDENQPKNKVSVMGNPSLGEVKTIMIGVRNNARSKKSVEVWVNELRLQDPAIDGGWAAQGNMNVQLSDLGSVNLTGHVETAGFGGLEEKVSERRMDNYYQYAVTTNFEAGRFFPEKAKVSIPLYFSYTKERLSPKFNPLDTDMLLEDALDAAIDSHEEDSIRSIAETVSTYRNFSVSNAKVNIASKNPMPYDPANFAFSYSYSKRDNSGETTTYEKEVDWKLGMNYNYAPVYKPLEPFKGMKSKSKWLQVVKDFGVNWLPQTVSFNTDINRHYYELQERDLENLDVSATLPVSFSQQYLWNRELAIRWDLTKNLKLNYTSATHAEIEEPYGPVNKDRYPDEYAAWKDSVKHSIIRLGRPMDYQQTFSASYQVPLNKIPATDWITADASFNSSYNWNRGTMLDNGMSLGNTIANQRTININGRFNMETLYNKVDFLKEANKRFATAKKQPTSKIARQNAKKQADRKKETEKKKREYNKEVQLLADTTVTIVHSRKTKRVEVRAVTADGKRYPIKYKVLDENKILIRNQDTVKIKLTVAPGPKPEEQKWYKTAQVIARGAMMVRNFSISYRNTYAMSVPGFIPSVGDAFGQGKNGGIFAPGLDFAFGIQGDDYLRRASERGWLMNSDSVATPATTNSMEDFQFKMTLEPFRDFKIDLNASRTMNRSRSIQYMYSGMPEVQSGNFSMTVVTIGTAFTSKGNSGNGYSSRTFDRFIRNLDVVHGRIESQYAGAVYPVGTALAGQPYDPVNGGVDKYSPDVMIPAFLAAYTGSDVGSSALDIFPSLLKMMPNWTIKYAGLGKLPWFSEHFKSVTLSHGYKSVYSVGSFNTYQSYWSFMGDRGFIENTQTGNPVPSSMYDVSTVSINESFSPLIGLDVTLLNNLSAKVELKKTRVLNLSMAANQIVETTSDDFVVGFGYKITNFKIFGGGGGSNNKKGRNAKNNNSKTTTRRGGVSNDLNLRADFSWREQNALCRDIQTVTTQATSGNKALKVSLSADYTVSRLLTVNAYYDMQRNEPLVSASAYPVTNMDFGISLKFSLTR